MSKHRAKVRTRSQKIGDKAEYAFGAWATERGLSPNLISRDYGLDYLCQVFDNVPGSTSEEVHGAVLAVQVRATEGDARPRIKVTREDAENLLRQTNPCCVVGLNPTAGPVAFRFVDESFAAQLQSFLESRLHTLALRLDQMDNDPAIFDQNLHELRKPGTQYRLRLEAVRRRLAQAVPGAAIQTHSLHPGSLDTLVTVPWLGSIFEMEDTVRDTVRARVFETGELPFHTFGASVRPELLAVEELTDGEMFVAGVGESSQKLAVCLAKESADLVFCVRRLADEFAYTHPVGITFVLSDARRKGKIWAHELEVRLFPGEPLSEHSSALPFLRLLRPEAKLDLGKGPALLLKHWGDSVTAVGSSILGLERLVHELVITLNEFRLSDLNDEEFARSTSFAYGFMCAGIPVEQFVPGVLVGEAASASPDELMSQNVLIKLPITFNLMHHGVVVWVETEGFCYFAEGGGVVGLRPTRQLGWGLELHKRFEKSRYPEAWINTNLPPLRIGAEETGSRRFKVEESASVLFGAVIRKPLPTE